MLLLVLPFLFAALSYPPRTIAAVGIADLIAFFVVAFGVGGGFPLSGFGLFAMLCIGAAGRLGGTQSGARSARSSTRTAAARLRSEDSSRIQTIQQMEVARFGQLALEGADIDALALEATRIDGQRPWRSTSAA